MAICSICGGAVPCGIVAHKERVEGLDHVHAAGGCYCGECLSYLSVNHFQGEGLCVVSKRSVSTRDFCSLGCPAKQHLGTDSSIDLSAK